MAEISKKAFRELTRGYIRKLADDFGLRDWTFEVNRIDEEETRQDNEVLATVRPCYGRKLAEIRLHPPFFDLPPDKQRHVLIHEFTHCHFAAVQQQIEYDLKEHFSDSAYSVFFDGFRRNLEYAVDGIATAVEDRFPVPSVIPRA